jgi:hypothetical protein
MASGSGSKGLAFLAVLLMAAGGWNYKRNADIENAKPRPYRGYSDVDLAVLMDAYGGEVERHSRTLEAVGRDDVVVQGRARLRDQVREFERVQKVHDQRRSLKGNVAENEASRSQIKLELQKRAADRPAYRMVLRRVTTFQPL